MEKRLLDLCHYRLEIAGEDLETESDIDKQEA
jgi:hypothetical protein